MESIGKKVLFFAIWTILFTPILSQNIIFRASVDRNKIQQGEVIRYSVEVTSDGAGELPTITLKKLNDFNILGTSSYSSTNYTIINGRTEQKITKTFQFSIEPKGVGTFTIPSLSTKIGGKVYKTKPISITVTEFRGEPSNTQKTFLIADIPKKSVYLREPFELNFYFYTKEQIEGLRIAENIDFGSFWKEELYSAKEIKFNQSIVGGEIYNAMLLKSYLLVPQEPGKQKIPTLKMETSIRVDSRDFFNFGRSKTFQLVSRKAEIDVKELPTPPMDYMGSVGRFNITSSVDKTTLKAGDPLTYSLKIKGEGSFNDENPSFNESSFFRFSEPEVQVKKDGTNFEKIVKYLVIPKQEGEYVIPKVKFIYFDPKLKDYVVKQTNEFKINISPSEDFSYTFGSSKTDIILKGKDIDFIVSDIQDKKRVILFEQFYYWLTYIFLLLSLLIFFPIYFRQQKLAKNITYKKQRFAKKMFIKHFKWIKPLAKKGDIHFYSEAQNAIINFLCDRFVLTKDLTVEKMFETLLKKGINHKTLNVLKELIDKFNQARFMPGKVSKGQIEKDYENVSKVLKLIIKMDDKR